MFSNYSPVKTYRKATYSSIDPTLPAHSLAGKTVLIVGGAAGIGLNISKSLATAGVSNLIIIARRPDVLAKAKHTVESLQPATRVHTYSASIADLEGIVKVFADIRASHDIGEPSVLILVAAFQPPHEPTLALPDEDLVDTLNTNVIGNFHAVREFLRVPSTADRPKQIIDISSGGAYVRREGHTFYSATKAAFSAILDQIHVDAQSEQWKSEGPWDKRWGSKEGVKQVGLRTVSVHPGSVFTEMAIKSGYGPNDFPWDDPSLTGDFVVWLISPDADFLNGRFVWVNWDVDELKALKEKILASPRMLQFALALE